MRWSWLVISLAAITLPAVAAAQTIAFCVTLDGGQEVPPVATFSGGYGTVTYDTVARTLVLDIIYDMESAAFAAHIHGPAPPGENAPRVADLTLSNPYSGTITNTVGPITEDEEADLLGGLWYINIHTDAHEGGEIRGQIANCPVPVEPTTWGRIKAFYR
jgi:hypothetical protein